MECFSISNDETEQTTTAGSKSVHLKMCMKPADNSNDCSI